MHRLRVLLLLVGGPLFAQAPTAPHLAGKLVDLGGHQHLHLNCTGHGRPAVVLESGAGDFSVVWALVQPKVAMFTRVCSYDRGGYASSDPGTRPRAYAQLALELRTALDRERVRPPFVLVGQSYGGLVVRGFVTRYRSDVVGLVLVDAVHEDERIVYGGQPHRLRDGATGRAAPPPRIALDTEFVRLARDSAKLSGNAVLDAPLDRLPRTAQRVWQWGQSLPMYRMAWAAEMDWSPEELQRMHDSRLANRATFGNMPLIVLARTAGEYANGMTISGDSLERERRFFVADLAALSTSGRFRYATRSGHNIQLEEPALVVEAVKDVVTAARAAFRKR